MNENERPPIPPSLNQVTPNRGMSRKRKIVVAVSLIFLCVIGVILLSILVLLAIGLNMAVTI